MFEGRYKSIPVQDDRYLLSLLRYVHQNPVKAKMCERVEDYSWSSDSYYRKYPFGFIYTDFIMKMISQDYIDALSTYICFMSQDILEEETTFETIDCIGENSIIKAIDKAESIKRPNLDQILHDIGINEQEYQRIKNGSRIRSLTDYKAAYVQVSLKYQYTLKEIGENIGLKQSVIHKLKSGLHTE